jgi:hypothetical protein
VERNALSALGAVLDRLGVRWVLIGALAANRYRSSPRLTRDVDLLLSDSGASLDSLEAHLVREGWRVRRASAEGDLLRLLHPDLGVADLLIAGTDYQQEAIRRARSESMGAGISVPVLAPEDVILHKLIAGRTQDLADIEAILDARPALDDAYLQRWIEFWELRAPWDSLLSRR